MSVLELHFGVFELLPNLVLGRIKEGIHFNKELNTILGERLIAHYGEDEPLGYVSIRENSYSIDPLIHLHNSRYDKLCCIGIVESNQNILSSVSLESKFFKQGKLKAFQYHIDAIEWTKKELLKNLDINFENHLN